MISSLCANSTGCELAVLPTWVASTHINSKTSEHQPVMILTSYIPGGSMLLGLEGSVYAVGVIEEEENHTNIY